MTPRTIGVAGPRPSPLLLRMVDAGWLGKKSGKGFYDDGAVSAGAG